MLLRLAEPLSPKFCAEDTPLPLPGQYLGPTRVVTGVALQRSGKRGSSVPSRVPSPVIAPLGRQYRALRCSPIAVALVPGAWVKTLSAPFSTNRIDGRALPNVEG